jgi:hypothetical protein
MLTVRRLSLLILCLLGVQELVFGQGRPLFDVKQFGAAGNGVALDTASINRAVDACAAAGGGTVYFPAGTYLSGTVRLKDNVTLWLDSGAVLLGAKDLRQYETGVKGDAWYAALILGKQTHNAAVMGHGIIDGNQVFNPDGEEHMRGPHGVLFYDSQDVSVQGITVKDAGNYAVILRSCLRVKIDGLTVKGGWDGINMHDVKDATIANCHLFTGDDSLAGAYWENVTVTNSILNSSANAIRVGGRNVLFDNCVIYGPGESVHRTSLRHNTESGFQILPNSASEKNKYAAKGPVDNMVLSNITMVNVVSPIFIAYSNDAPYSRNNLGVGRIIVNNLTVLQAQETPIYISAPPNDPAESVILNNVRVSYEGGATESEAEQQGFSPYSVLQSFALYCRNVRHLELHDVRMSVQKKDTRPALFVKNVGTLEMDRFQGPKTSAGADTLQASALGHVFADGEEVKPASVIVRSIELPSSQVYAGQPFSFTVTVQDAGSSGLAPISVQLGDQKLSRSVWLRSGEIARLYFINVRHNEPGQLQVRAGDISRQLSVLEKVGGHAVGLPYREFRNIAGEVLQFGGSIYIRAQGDNPVMQYGDQYITAYVKHGLPRDGVIITKVDNPDLRSSWVGRAGIMVRNDISKPGQSTGYVVLDSSPSNGSYLEWDADRNGTLDQHTEFEGQTLWPHWLKLERHGTDFAGYSSVDGQTWSKVGEVNVPGAGELEDAGVFAYRDSAQFENFRIQSNK